MRIAKNLYKRHRFPPEIIQYAVWLYHRFNLSHRDVEDLLAERNISVSYEAIRLWCNKVGVVYVRHLKRRHLGYGEVVDVFLQKKRDGKAAKHFFERLLKTNRRPPRKVVTDKLSSYDVAHRELIPESTQVTPTGPEILDCSCSRTQSVQP